MKNRRGFTKRRKKKSEEGRRTTAYSKYIRDGNGKSLHPRILKCKECDMNPSGDCDHLPHNLRAL